MTLQKSLSCESTATEASPPAAIQAGTAGARFLRSKAASGKTQVGSPDIPGKGAGPTPHGTSMQTAFHHPMSLFSRHPKNPILSAADWPYDINSVFNAGATLLADGTTLLLCRVEDRRGHSHLCAARSKNGV